MSPRMVWISAFALLVAVIVGAVALWPRQAAVPDRLQAVAGTPLFDIDMRDLAELLVVERVGGMVAKSRNDGSGVWEANALGPDGKAIAGPAILLDVAAIRSAVRLLSDARIAGPADPAAEFNAAEYTRLTLKGGQTRELRFGSRSLGGTVALRITDGSGQSVARTALVNESLKIMLTSQSIAAWREGRILGDEIADARRLSISGATGFPNMTLLRVAGGWALTEPVAAPANEAAVGRLLGVLGQLRVTKWHGAGERPVGAGAVGSAEAPIAEPVMSVRIESERRTIAPTGGPISAQVSLETRVTTLVFGAPSGFGGPNLLGTVDGGESYFTIATSAVTAIGSIGADASTYIAPVAFGFKAADIGSVTMTIDAGLSGPDSPGRRLVLRRAGVGDGPGDAVDARWLEQRDDQLAIRMTAKNMLAADAVLAWLCTVAASRVAIEPDAAWRAVGTVQIVSLGGQPLGECVLMVDAPTGAVVLASGRAHRVYDAASVPSMVREYLSGVSTVPTPPSTGAAQPVEPK